MAKLRETIAELEAILADPGRLRQVIKDELGEVRAKHADAPPGPDHLRPGRPRHPRPHRRRGPGRHHVQGRLHQDGGGRRLPHPGPRRPGRGRGPSCATTTTSSASVHTTAHAFLLFFSNRGKVYRLKAHEIPMKERTARGTAIVNLLPLVPGEKIQAIIDTRDYETSRFLVLRHQEGPGQEDPLHRVRLVPARRPHRHQPAGRRRAGAGHPDRRRRRHLHGRQVGHDRPLLARTRCGPRAGRPRACIGMRLRDDDEVVSADVARARTRPTCSSSPTPATASAPSSTRFPRKGRGTMGVRGIRLTARRGYVVAAFMVGLDDEIFLISSGGTTIRMAGPRHLVPGTRRHRRQGHEPRRGPVGRGGRARLRRRRLGLPPPHFPLSTSWCEGGFDVLQTVGRGERGSVLPLMALAVGAGGGGRWSDRPAGGGGHRPGRARAAADAAALAGAAEGESPARELAAANGAEMTSFEAKGTDALVEVRAGHGPGGRPGPAVPRRSSAGSTGRRWAGGRRRPGAGHAGRPGRAEPTPGRGVAVTGPSARLGRRRPGRGCRALAGVAPSAGLCRPDPDARPTLFEVCQAGDGDP